MTNEELTRLDALAAAATPGPWHTDADTCPEYDDPAVMAGKQWVCATSYDTLSTSIGERDIKADAAFIAAARDAVPALVAEVRRLRGLVEAAYREAHAELHPLGDSKANPRYWEPSALVDYKRDEDRGWEASAVRKALDGAA